MNKEEMQLAFVGGNVGALVGASWVGLVLAATGLLSEHFLYYLGGVGAGMLIGNLLLLAYIAGSE